MGKFWRFRLREMALKGAKPLLSRKYQKIDKAEEKEGVKLIGKLSQGERKELVRRGLIGSYYTSDKYKKKLGL